MSKAMTLALALAFVAGGAFAQQDAPKLKIGAKVGNKVPAYKAGASDLALVDEKKVEFDSHKTKTATAYVFMSTTCPYVKAYRERLAGIGKKYGKKGVQFVFVYPNRKEALKDKVSYHRKYGFTGLWLEDKKASFAKALQVDKTPLVVLADKQGKIVFRGGIDDNPFDAKKVKRPYFTNAIDDVLAGRKVKVKTARTYG